jgi:CMP-N-acetylneuraminic acid synthetase
MKITAILTGKKNSSFKNKNIIKILGKRIFMYPAEVAKKSKKINDFYSSSDSSIILEETKKIGFVSIKRPKKLSMSESKHKDVILHALRFIKNKTKEFPDILVILLANSPTIKTSWINNCIEILIKKKATAVVPVVKNNDNHPYRAKKIKNGYLRPFMNIAKNVSTNRQNLQSCYFLAHNFWVIKTSNIFLNNGFLPWSFMGKKVVPYIINSSIDIHELDDLDKCKKWIKKNNTRFS